MRALKIIGILLGVYIAVVVIFESLIGYFQPQGGSTLVITTSDDAGQRNDRVLALLQADDNIYVAANHWPRAWFRQATANPSVAATIGGEKADYIAVPVGDAEHERVNSANELGLTFRILTGFPPRYFLRLDPQH